ncbi:TPA: ribonuclease P [Methanosarcinaceae archaeon]|nr:ribonuclease P [Methanosarcinaceae archaeon]
MKHLMPSLRSKKRYLAFELFSEEPVNRGELVRDVISSASALLGDVLASECDIHVLGFEAGKGIIQCSHSKVTETRAALAAITRVNRLRATLHVLGVSGTIKRATEKYLNDDAGFEPNLKAIEE